MWRSICGLLLQLTISLHQSKRGVRQAAGAAGDRVGLTHQLSTSSSAYVRAVNGTDPHAYDALFAEDAVVDDGGRVSRGREAIAGWVSSDIFEVNVWFSVLDASAAEGVETLTTEVDGTFDCTGLPDPVVVTHRLTTAGERITGLTCRWGLMNAG